MDFYGFHGGLFMDVVMSYGFHGMMSMSFEHGTTMGFDGVKPIELCIPTIRATAHDWTNKITSVLTNNNETVNQTTTLWFQ